MLRCISCIDGVCGASASGSLFCANDGAHATTPANNTAISEIILIIILIIVFFRRSLYRAASQHWIRTCT